jgi:hypothetical protein
MTLRLTRSGRLWTLLFLGLEVLLLRSEKSHFSRFSEDTQRRDFRPLEDKVVFVTFKYSTSEISRVSIKEHTYIKSPVELEYI